MNPQSTHDDGIMFQLDLNISSNRNGSCMSRVIYNLELFFKLTTGSKNKIPERDLKVKRYQELILTHLPWSLFLTYCQQALDSSTHSKTGVQLDRMKPQDGLRNGAW
jgi:hypothetical protein